MAAAAAAPASSRSAVTNRSDVQLPLSALTSENLRAAIAQGKCSLAELKRRLARLTNDASADSPRDVGDARLQALLADLCNDGWIYINGGGDYDML